MPSRTANRRRPPIRSPRGPFAGAGRGAAAVVALAVAWAPIAAPAPAAGEGGGPPDPADLAERLFDGEVGVDGPLPVRARLGEGEAGDGGDEGGDAAGAGGMRLLLETAVTVPETAPPGALRLTVVILPIDGEAELWRAPEAVPVDGGAGEWLIRTHVDLPADFAEVAVLVTGPAEDLWGMARAQLDGAPLAEPAAERIVDLGGDEVGGAAPATGAAAATGAVIRLMPPAKTPAVGRVRFRALAASPEVARVVFRVDGEVVATDGRAPFSQVVDLGGEERQRTVEVVAYSGGTRELGRDSLTVNAAASAFEVRVALTGGTVSAEVEVPAGRRLAAVDLFLNERLLARREGPPFETTLPPGTERGPSDFVRALAVLDDGSSLDDVLLLAAEQVAERVEVNLVEVYAVVSDRRGDAVADLAADDFELKRRGRAVAIDRFAKADDVPLGLGLVIDTSESMWPLMPDTKRAGAKFLARTLGDGDTAFLIDFDTRPRLAHPMTPDLPRLLSTFGGLEAGGYTALYDAILFAMLQFEEGPRRRALVVLTDGDDVESRYSAGRCVQVGRDLGVPVYIIDLSGARARAHWQWAAGGRKKLDLDAIAESTGGRVFYIADLAELDGAYDVINAELRNQYLLAFTTDRPLDDEELRQIDVEVKGRGLKVRSVVGAG